MQKDLILLAQWKSNSFCDWRMVSETGIRVIDMFIAVDVWLLQGSLKRQSKDTDNRDKNTETDGNIVTTNRMS